MNILMALERVLDLNNNSHKREHITITIQR